MKNDVRENFIDRSISNGSNQKMNAKELFLNNKDDGNVLDDKNRSHLETP